MRLIEVNVLKEWVENWFTKNRAYHPYAKNNNIPITELYDILEQMPSAQPELIERTAYIRGFEQGRTQGMIDSQAEHTKKGEKNMIKAEWTNADALNLQPTCNQLATSCISRQAAIDAIRHIEEIYVNNLPTMIDKASAQTELMLLPSAQPEPIKGKWLERSVDVDGKKSIEEWQSAKCSVCGRYHTTPYLYYFDDFNFCPNCGAKMEVEK